MATYYVSTAGNNGNPGTIGSPWRTIAFSATQAVAGDIVYVRGLGTAYNEALTNFPNSGTSFSNAITFAAYPGESPILRPSSGLFAMFLGQTSVPHHIIWDGIEVDGSSVTAYTIKGETGSTYGFHHFRFQNCTIRPPSSPGSGTGSTVILYNSPANPTQGWNNEFLNCHVYGGGHVDNGSDHNFYIATPQNIVDGCNIEGMTGAGVQIWNQFVNDGLMSQGPDDNIIRNCYIHDGQTGVGAFARGWGVITGMGDRTQIYNNVIVRAAQHPTSYSAGIAILSTDDALVYNNTITDCLQRGLGIDPGNDNTLVTNNIIYNNGNDVADFGTGTSYTTNKISIDPDFVDAGNDNYRVQIGSVCIDAGTTLVLFNTDIAGITRPQGSAWDIGAYEQFNQSGAVLPIVSQDLPQNGGTTNPASTIGYDVLAVFVSWVGSLGGGINPSLSDSETNTWVPETVYTPASNNIAGRWFYCIAPFTDAAHTFTTNITSGYPSIVVVGFSGEWQFDAVIGSSAESTGTESAQAGSITPTNNGAIILQGLATNAFDFSTPQQGMGIDSGYVIVASVQNLPGVSVGNFVAALEQVSIGATNPEWTWTIEAAIGASALAFVPAPGGCADPATLPQTFVGTNGTDLEVHNCNWVEELSTFEILSNEIVPGDTNAETAASWEGTSFGANQFASAVIGALGSGNWVGVGVHLSSGNGYGTYTDLDGSTVVFRYDSGTYVELGTAAVAFISTDTIYIQWNNGVITVKRIRGGTPTTLFTVSDSTYLTGNIGIVGFDGGGTSGLNSFTGGNLAGSGGHNLLLLGVGH